MNSHLDPIRIVDNGFSASPPLQYLNLHISSLQGTRKKQNGQELCSRTPKTIKFLYQINPCNWIEENCLRRQCCKTVSTSNANIEYASNFYAITRTLMPLILLHKLSGSSSLQYMNLLMWNLQATTGKAKRPTSICTHTKNIKWSVQQITQILMQLELSPLCHSKTCKGQKVSQMTDKYLRTHQKHKIVEPTNPSNIHAI